MEKQYISSRCKIIVKIAVQFIIKRLKHRFAMSKSDYQQSLDYLTKSFNVFVHLTVDYLKNWGSDSSTHMLRKIFGTIWIHPNGMVNLVKLLSLDYQTIVPYPQAVDFNQVEGQKMVPNCPAIQYKEQPQQKEYKVVGNQRQLISEEMGYDSVKEEEGYSEQQSEVDQEKMQVSYESDYGQSQGKTYKRGPYKSYTVKEKLQAVELFQEQSLSITEISRSLGIPCKNIKRWATEGVSRKRGGGRRRTSPGLEEEVYRWMLTYHMRGDRVHVQQIQQYALSRARDDSFKASRGWAMKFIQRYRLRTMYMIK